MIGIKAIRACNRKVMIPLFAASLFLVSISAAFAAQEHQKIDIKPAVVEIGTFYNGVNLTVSGKIPEDCEAVAVFSGERSTLHLKEKGKALGLLWMNMDSLTVENVPSVFLVSSEKPIDPAASDDTASVSSVGIEGLAKNIKVKKEKSDSEGDSGSYVEELIKLKKKETLYGEQVESVKYSGGADGYRDFTAEISLPSHLSPGKYSVDLYTVKDRKVVDHSSQEIKAVAAGVPDILGKLAFGHSLLYGILATLIAIIGGLVIGFVFQGSKGGAH